MQRQREQKFKENIERLKKEHAQRMQELVDFEQKYLKQRDEITKKQKPLHIRWIRKYRTKLNKQR